MLAFTVTGASVARDRYEASLGLNYQVSVLTVCASYTRQARSGLDVNGVMVKARTRFRGGRERELLRAPVIPKNNNLFS